MPKIILQFTSDRRPSCLYKCVGGGGGGGGEGRTMIMILKQSTSPYFTTFKFLLCSECSTSGEHESKNCCTFKWADTLL